MMIWSVLSLLTFSALGHRSNRPILDFTQFLTTDPTVLPDMMPTLTGWVAM